MSTVTLSTNAERHAETAENLKAFSGIKLLYVKQQVATILAQIGKGGIFDEYTKHDISHIDYMLKSLDWIIPTETQKIMTPSDWMMITLAIYFHDLGMLVTKDEYDKRNQTAFAIFRENVIDGRMGLDFKDKILQLEEEHQERFLYQEYVRRTHAERIRRWIVDEPSTIYPTIIPIVDEIRKLIGNANMMFLRDLAFVCESHHLSDLDDQDKYKINQQYGPTNEEIVNVQYAALLLRSADLLHITSDRTPSLEFILINPTDPISQEEWAKQQAVNAIRPVSKIDKEGNVDESLQKDTLEVIAYFKEEKGFFGLTSYLSYADQQLKENHKFNEQSKKKFSHKYEYPWRHIDDSKIEAENFEKRQFEFVIDQTRILDLLVGHTLYNDHTVVLRELIQNAVDASKLKKHEYETNGYKEFYPEININWNKGSRELSFSDNGTGMTLDIIENHLLKVGSSRYQDAEFKKRYPEFSPISRFGIGLLTCFLIADNVDILTKSEDSEKAILLKIRKVHGKYLLKYVNPMEIIDKINTHGTEIKLYVRADVQLNHIHNEINKWILIPECKMNLTYDGKTYSIGNSSPKELLIQHLNKVGLKVDDKKIKVHQECEDGITLAYGLKYLEHLKEWTFLETSEGVFGDLPVGICIEGIRVDFDSPGFTTKNFYALANASGKKAPKTNVARSTIELTPEKKALTYDIHRLYLKHITNEIESLKKAGFSISWAANEAQWLLASFIRSGRRYGSDDTNLSDAESFINALKKVKFLLIEKEKSRDLISLEDLISLKHFWIIECAAYFSADSLIKEVKSSNTSVTALLNTIYGGEESNLKHIDCLLSGKILDQKLNNIIFEHFQIDQIKIIPEQRRLDLKWSIVEENIWEVISMIDNYSSATKFYVQIKEHDFGQKIEEAAITTSNYILILIGSPLNTYLQGLLKMYPSKSREDVFVLSKAVEILHSFFYLTDLEPGKVEEQIDSIMQRNNNRDNGKLLWSKIDKKELMSTILQSHFSKYDTSIWNRREMYY